MVCPMKLRESAFAHHTLDGVPIDLLFRRLDSNIESPDRNPPVMGHCSPVNFMMNLVVTLISYTV